MIKNNGLKMKEENFQKYLEEIMNMMKQTML